jgi:hypothetical protein
MEIQSAHMTNLKWQQCCFKVLRLRDTCNHIISLSVSFLLLSFFHPNSFCLLFRRILYHCLNLELDLCFRFLCLFPANLLANWIPVFWRTWLQPGFSPVLYFPCTNLLLMHFHTPCTFLRSPFSPSFLPLFHLFNFYQSFKS